MIILMLSANPYLTPQEREILQLWEKALEMRKKLTKPFSIPRADEDDNNPNYEQDACSANCRKGSCSVSCYGTVVCGCTSAGEPVCMCLDSDIIPTSNKYGHNKRLQKANEPLTISSTIGGLKVRAFSKDKPISVEVWDVSGRRIGRYWVRGERTISLKPGIYFVRALGKVRKVIVK